MSGLLISNGAGGENPAAQVPFQDDLSCPHDLPYIKITVRNTGGTDASGTKLQAFCGPDAVPPASGTFGVAYSGGAAGPISVSASSTATPGFTITTLPPGGTAVLYFRMRAALISTYNSAVFVQAQLTPGPTTNDTLLYNNTAGTLVTADGSVGCSSM